MEDEIAGSCSAGCRAEETDVTVVMSVLLYGAETLTVKAERIRYIPEINNFVGFSVCRRTMHYTTESLIAPSECTTSKHVVKGKHVIKLRFLILVAVTFNPADALKLTGALIHTLFVVWFVLTAFKASYTK